MSFLKKLASLFSSSQSSEQFKQPVYLRCKVCGEPLKAEVDLRNELSPEWENAGGSDQPDYYTCRKTVIGSHRCYNPVEVEMTFDRQRKLQSQQVIGGSVITEEEYEQAVCEWEENDSATQ